MDIFVSPTSGGVRVVEMAAIPFSVITLKPVRATPTCDNSAHPRLIFPAIISYIVVERRKYQKSIVKTLVAVNRNISGIVKEWKPLGLPGPMRKSTKAESL